MEHDTECEGSLVLRQMAHDRMKLDWLEKAYVEGHFCFCEMRRELSRGPRTHEVNSLIRMARVWWLLRQQRTSLGHAEARERAIKVVMDQASLSEVGLDISSEVVEVDFRNRVRLNRAHSR